jgi:hypothetical protein
LVRKYQPATQLVADADSSESLLFDTRAGQGYEWFRLAFVRAPQSRWLVPDGTKEKPPAKRSIREEASGT